ncbi:hypothetical protein QBC47DRAFT_388582 [Echria macrotheca]|uniref:Pt repeat family protein n=1 Tax=Echria macrotheca TaxID=438768 RepID=A0AAJ0F6L0_9PEZI|nr:hypothetical protein QBC47DRAFT_388582 [Echria macrotheca]
MAWWDAKKQRRRGTAACAPAPCSPNSPPNSKARIALGDAFPRLELDSTTTSTNMTMDQRRATLEPVFENHHQPDLPLTPALTVHVEIQFTDPVIRSRYTRTYASSADFAPTARICKGLVRRIERCSHELLTRKDSAALDMFKDGTFECKPLRYEMAFRICTGDRGDWAERTFRSYQKQPLTVALTKDIILASHRMVGLFLRRHDKGFRWLDGAVRDPSLDGPQAMIPSVDGPLSLLCVPASRFIESSQSFEFVPGYRIELSFRSRNPQRRAPQFGKTIRISSKQTAPLTLFMSEDQLWRGLQAINRGLEPRKQAFDSHLKSCRGGECHHSDEASLHIELRVANNIGPLYSHICRSVESKLALFRDFEARDCEDFLATMEAALADIRNETDAKIEELNDFELRIVELRGTGWSARQPAKFTLDSSVSYGRRTIQAALDRIQTGIADVIRGHDIAIHFSGYKRGHLILDKAIVAHAKRGVPKESFSSPEEAQKVFVGRLKSRIQKDIDLVFEDTCSIDDIPEETERPASSLTAVETKSNSPDASPRRDPTHNQTRSIPTTPTKESPKPKVQRMFSLTGGRSPRGEMESVKSARSIGDLKSESCGNKATSVPEDTSDNASVLSEEQPPMVVSAPVRPAQRRFPLLSKRYSSRVSNASTLIEEFLGGLDNVSTTDLVHEGPVDKVEDTSQDKSKSMSGALNAMTSGEEESDHVDAGARVNPGSEVGQRLKDASNCASAPSAGIAAISHTKMDSPEAFEDAEEFARVGFPDTGGLDAPAPLLDLASPSLDMYSTAPSTPGLSTGADSSPRNSILITPTFLRTLSGTRDSVVLKDLDPESEPEGAAMNVMAKIDAAAVNNEGADADRIHRPESCPLSPAPEMTTAPPTPTVKPDGTDSLAERAGSKIATEAVGIEVVAQGKSTLELGAERSSEQPEDGGAQQPYISANHIAALEHSSESTAVPEADHATDPSDLDATGLMADRLFGPANLWGILAGSEGHSGDGDVVTEVLAEAGTESGSPANLWGIVAGSEGQAEVVESVDELSSRAGELRQTPGNLWGILSSEGDPADAQGADGIPSEAVNQSETPVDLGEVSTDHSEDVATVTEVPSETGNGSEDPTDLREIPTGRPEDVESATEGTSKTIDQPENSAEVREISSGHPEDLVTEIASETQDQPESPATLREILTGQDDSAPEISSEAGNQLEAQLAGTPANLWGVLSGPAPFAVGKLQPNNASQTRELSLAAPVPEPDVLLRSESEEVSSTGPEALDNIIAGTDTTEPKLSGVDREPSPVECAEEPEVRQEPAPVTEEPVLEIAGSEANPSPNKDDEPSATPETDVPEQIEVAETLSQPDSEAVDETAPGIVLAKDPQPGPEASEVDRVSDVVPEPTPSEKSNVVESREITSTDNVESTETVEINDVTESQDVVPTGDKSCEAHEVSDIAAPQDAVPTDNSQAEDVNNVSESHDAVLADNPEPAEVDDSEDGDEDTLVSVEPEDVPAVHVDGLEKPLKVVEAISVNEIVEKPGVEEPAVIESLEPKADKEQPADASDEAPATVASDEAQNNTEPVDEQPPIAPEISVEDSTAPVPEDVSATEVTSNGVPTAEQAKPTAIVVPTPAPAPSPRTSTSTFSTADYSSFASTRGSVETMRPVETEPQPPASHDQSHSRPQTACFLGLREKGMLDVGLRGALGDARRLSLPFNNLVDQDGAGVVTVIGTPAVSAVGSGRVKKRGEDKKKMRSVTREVEEEDEGSALPRMMMLLAGVVALGKVIKGSSR